MREVAETPQSARTTLSLEEQVARLHALLEASRQVHSTIAVDDVLKQTTRILVRELEVDGALFLGSSGDDAIAACGLAPEKPYATYPQFPLLSRDGTRLSLLIVRPATGYSLSDYEQDFIEGLVLQAAVALENATLHERGLRWARMQQDLDAARAVQRSMLPKAMPTIAELSIAAHMETCYEVGGDYLDTFGMLDGSQLFIVADVAGKGLASAIVATSFRAAFRSLATQPLSLVEMVERVGQAHWEEGDEARRRYVTAICARYDAATQTIEVVNAGHNPGLLIRPDGSSRMLDASGTPLGMLPAMSYAAEIIPFPVGSRLLLYTDGLTEIFCKEEEFGCERLTELFRTLQTRDAKESLRAIWEQLHQFSAGSSQTDDMTALAMIRRASGAEGEPAA